MVFSILVLFPILLIIGLIFASKKYFSEQTIEELYIYLIRFVTLMMMIGGSIYAFSSLADLIIPIDENQTYVVNKFMKSFIWIVVPLPFFLYFKKKSK